MVQFNVIVRHHDSFLTRPTIIHDFANADNDGIASFLLNDPFLSCPKFNPGETVDQAWDKLVKPIEDAIQLFVPTRTVCARSSKKTRRYPRHIQRAVRKKCQRWRQYRKDRTSENKGLYTKQSLFVRKVIYDHHKQVEQSVIKRDKLNTFYRYVSGKLSCKSGVGPLKSSSGEAIVGDAEKAEALNSYFTSVFTVDDGILPDFDRRVDDSVFH